MSRFGKDSVRRRVGVALMATSLGVAGSVLSLAPAGAQAEPQEITVEAVAHFKHNAGQAAPNTLTSEFPPGVVCVVQPAFCPEELSPVTGPVGDALGEVEEAPEDELPVAAVQPGTLPVEVAFGVERYAAAVKFTLPELPEGEAPAQLVLRLQQTNPTYHSSSPSFRQAVLAAVAFAGSRNPEVFQEEFAKALEQQPVERDQFLGVEACPTTTAWDGGDFAQPEEAKPEVDCLFGANGIKGEDGVWEFDLSFAADAWYSGELENTGILLRTTGAPNLAFGDPDSSTNSRVTFQPTGSTVEVTSQPESSAPPAFTPPPANDSSSGGFSAPASSGNIFAPPANFTPEVAEANPQVAAPAGGETVAQQPVAAVPFTEGDAVTPWWIWLLVPVFLAGMYLTANSLTTEMVLASDRKGAMMRLIEQRRGGELAMAGASAAPAAPREGALSRLTKK